MKNSLCLLLCCIFWMPTKALGQTISHTDSISVYIFLDETCVISQYYTLTLKALNQEFGKEHLQFIGLFPNFSSKPAKIKIFKETSDKIERPLQSSPFTPFDILEEDGAQRNFFFFANMKKEIRDAKEVTKDVSLISVYPHCHYLGQSWKIFAVTPNADTINIIEIPEWDFNWQGAYTFDRMKKIPEGSVIYANALYDNTTDNPFNPSNPPVFSTWGEGTTDEMFLVGLNFVDYQEGDEAVIIGEDFSTSVNNESVQTKNILYPPFPNPAKEELSFNFYLDHPQTISIAIYDMAGKETQKIIENNQFTAGNHRQTIDVGTMSGGAYLIMMRGENFVLSENLLLVDK